MLGMHAVILATPGPSPALCACTGSTVGHSHPNESCCYIRRFHEGATLFLAFRICAYPGDLNVVQLLLPVENTLHPVHPHVDVSNQDRLADPLN